MTDICPICERGELVSAVVVETLAYAGDLIMVSGIQISKCPACGEEVVLPAQAKVNERLFADAKRAHDGLLTSTEIKRLRSTLGITQAEAAEMFGGGANAFSKYERGEVIQSKPMDLLMRLAMDEQVVRARLGAKIGRLTEEAVCAESVVFEASHAVWESIPVIGAAAELIRIAQAPRKQSWFSELSGFVSSIHSSANDSHWVNEKCGGYV